MIYSDAFYVKFFLALVFPARSTGGVKNISTRRAFHGPGGERVFARGDHHRMPARFGSGDFANIRARYKAYYFNHI